MGLAEGILGRSSVVTGKRSSCSEVDVVEGFQGLFTSSHVNVFAYILAVRWPTFDDCSPLRWFSGSRDISGVDL